MNILESMAHAYGLYAGIFITILTYLYYFSLRGKNKSGRPVSFLRSALSLPAALWLILVILALFYDAGPMP